ncbi:MAG: glycosyltransferase family 4 protein [Caldicoprobacterales bacterium]|jgi:glycosyltransferase involved in cell wall biosynthesis|nr:glycosyltransferase family 4 protein [Clostridiales bacterium]
MRVMEIIREAEGGMKTHFLSLVKGLSGQGIEVIALCNFDIKSKKLLKEAGVRVISFSFPGTIKPFSDCTAAIRIATLIRKTRPDIVHCHGFKAGLLGRIAGQITGISMVYTVHNFVAYGRGEYSIRLIRYLEGCISRKADAIICVSEALKKNMVEEMGMDDKRLSVIYNSIPDLPPGDRKATRQKHNIDDTDILIGTAARLIPSKGIDILLKAASGILAVHPHVRLLIAGSGPEEKKLKELVQTMGIGARVVFTGRVSDMENYYSAFDIFVLPTLSEGLGITVLEAMSFGLPVVATKTGGIPEWVVHRKNGLLVQPGNVMELRTALQFMLDNPAKAVQYGCNAKADIKKGLTQHKMIEETVSVLKCIYNKKKTDITGGK